MKTYAYRTPVGKGYVRVQGDMVAGILLPGCASPGKTEKGEPRGLAADTIGLLEAYFRGEAFGRKPELKLILDYAGMGGFTRLVMEEVARIPYGETRSYGDVARAAGSPRAARAVGNIMARNPFPVLVPCHRVVRSNGEPGGFGGGPGLKAWMLEMETRALC